MLNDFVNAEVKMDSLQVRKILIVDDEPDVQDVLADHLKSLGAQLSFASDGVVALDLLKKEAFDIVLCDIAMPNMNGLELLAEVRHHCLPATFVMLTGFGDREKILKALRLGAIDFLDKPFDSEKLKSTITNLIEVGLRRRMIAEAFQSSEKPPVERIKSAEKMAALFQIKNDSDRTTKS